MKTIFVSHFNHRIKILKKESGKHKKKEIKLKIVGKYWKKESKEAKHTKRKRNTLKKREQ